MDITSFIESLKAQDCKDTGERRFCIGLDPSLNNFAFAIWDTVLNEFAALQSMNAGQALIVLDTLARFLGRRALFVIEFPAIQSATFAAYSNSDKNSAYCAKLGWNAGYSACCAEIAKRVLDEIFDALYTLVNPSMRTRVKGISKPNPLHALPTKSSQEYFASATGCTQRTNEHERDAAFLVFGRDANKILLESRHYSKVKKSFKRR